MLGANSIHNVGIRRMIGSLATPQYRSFEINGAQKYQVARAVSYSHAGNSYAKGQTIAYDAAGGTAYSNTARLARDFNRGCSTRSIDRCSTPRRCAAPSPESAGRPATASAAKRTPSPAPRWPEDSLRWMRFDHRRAPLAPNRLARLRSAIVGNLRPTTSRTLGGVKVRGFGTGSGSRTRRTCARSQR